MGASSMAERTQWASRTGFILAAAGSAVGLGNIWKFPYITGENGGGLFVLIYLLCIALVGIPIMMAEIMIGRAAQKQPVGAFQVLQGKSSGWAGVGWLGVIAGFIISSYYVVVAGWAMDYTLKSVVNFTNPIYEQAEVDATAYRANTTLDDMRLMLVETQVGQETKADITAIRAEAKPSTWRGFARFQNALEKAKDPAQARQRLLLDPKLNTQVEQAEALNADIDAVRATATARIQAQIAQYPDEVVLEDAETAHRRQVIFKHVQANFVALASDGWTCTLWAGIFIFITITIVGGGIRKGIERTCRILMPMLFVLILVMVVYGAFKPGFGEAISFVFKPDPSKLKASGVLEALGHAFFTLSLGMGAMITYGSYQRSKSGLGMQSVSIAVLDTAVALLACMMIFPIIFSYGQEPTGGPGLVFMSMPLAFAEIGRGGMLLAILFFGLLVVAAITSAISLLEVVVSYFIDQQNWPRKRAAWIIGGVIFLFSIPSAFSLDPEFIMSGWEPSFGKNFFDTMDYLATNWLLPLGGLFVAIYAGWVMPRRLRNAEVKGMAPALFMGWLLLVRFVAPALVIIVLVQKVGIIDANELFHGLFS
jgi:SNF family Na+-dependent transporter